MSYVRTEKKYKLWVFSNVLTENLTGRETQNNAKLWRPSSILGLSDNENTPRRKIGLEVLEGEGDRSTLNPEVDAFTSRADVRRVAHDRTADAAKSRCRWIASIAAAYRKVAISFRRRRLRRQTFVTYAIVLWRHFRSSSAADVWSRL